MKNKRAEFYIISALIMIAIISSLSAKANVAFTAPSPVKFYDLSDNFEKEGYKIIDTYVFKGNKDEIAAQIENFTTNFLQYAREKDPNVGLVYIYGNETNVLVSNHAFTEINETTSSTETKRLQSPDISSISNITINVSGKSMTKDVAQRAAMFNVLSEAFHTKTGTKWVVLNIAGALYPFNTADEKDFYVVVTTKTPTKEDIFAGSESTQTCTSPYTTYDTNNVNLRCGIPNPAVTTCCTSPVINCITTLSERSDIATCANSSIHNGICAAPGVEGCVNDCPDGPICSQGGCKCGEESKNVAGSCSDGFDNNGDGYYDGKGGTQDQCS